MNRKRVQMLRGMIAGIPETHFNIDILPWRDVPPCETVACMARWAWIYPPFVEAGIRRRRSPDRVVACHRFFGTRPPFFAGRMANERGTHKQIALRRLDKLLKTGTSATTAVQDE